MFRCCCFASDTVTTRSHIVNTGKGYIIAFCGWHLLLSGATGGGSIAFTLVNGCVTVSSQIIVPIHFHLYRKYALVENIGSILIQYFLVRCTVTVSGIYYVVDQHNNRTVM